MAALTYVRHHCIDEILEFSELWISVCVRFSQYKVLNDVGYTQGYRFLHIDHGLLKRISLYKITTGIKMNKKRIIYWSINNDIKVLLKRYEPHRKEYAAKQFFLSKLDEKFLFHYTHYFMY